MDFLGKTAVGIVVPFYNGHQYFDSLISSVNDVIDTKNYHVEILIVDNSPVDQPGFESKYPGVVRMRTKPYIGFGKACNAGYEYFKKRDFEFVLISNQDGRFGKDLISKLIQPLVSDKLILLSSPISSRYNSFQIEPFYIQYYLKDCENLIADLLFNKDRKDFYETKSVTGACLAIRVSPLFEKKLFDEVFFMYYEDEDLCRRVIMSGFKIVLVPNALFFHQHSNTSEGADRSKIELWKSVSAKYFRLKHQSNSRISSFYGISLMRYLVT